MLQTRVGKRTPGAAFVIAAQLVDEGLIDLDEGFRMMCTVRDDLDADVRIGDRVVAVVPPGTTAESLAFRRSEES